MNQMNKKEIIERSSGFWIVDDFGVVVDEPFFTYSEALEVLEKTS